MILLIIYLIIGSGIGLFVLVAKFRLSLQDQILQFEINNELAHKKNHLRWLKFRHIVILPFDVITTTCFWSFLIFHPFFQKKEKRDLNRLQIETNATYKISDHILSVFVFIFLLLFFFVFNSSNKNWIWLIYFGLTSRHIGYLLLPVSLQQRLKQSMRNQYLTFSLIMLFDFLSITICLFILLFWKDGIPPLDLKDYYSVIKQIISFRQIEISKEFSNVHSILIYLSGFLIYSNFIKSALKIKEFRRSDQDLSLLAKKCNILGDYNTALEYLSKTKAPSSTTLMGKMESFIGLNQYNMAFENAKLLFQMNPSFSDEFDEKFLIGATLSVHSYPKRIILSILKKLIQEDTDDLLLSTIMYSIIIRQNYRIKDFTQIYSINNFKDNYPLTYLMYLHELQEFDEANKIIENISPISKRDIFAITCLSFLNEGFMLMKNLKSKSNLEESEERQILILENHVYNWFDSNKNVLIELAKGMEKNFDRFISFSIFVKVVYFIKPFYEDSLEEIDYLIIEFKKFFENDEVMKAQAEDLFGTIDFLHNAVSKRENV